MGKDKKDNQKEKRKLSISRRDFLVTGGVVIASGALSSYACSKEPEKAAKTVDQGTRSKEMVESNYGDYAKYVVIEPQPSKLPPLPEGSVTNMAYLDGEVIEGAWNVICAWFWPRKEPMVVIPEPHYHDENEVIAFFGTNSEDPFDLCAVVELWMEDQKLTLTKSCLVYVPAKMKHSPLTLVKIDRPIFHFSSVTESKWIRK
jgi:hypothetical protein